jgi:tetratricopeptide (TPR) repeat protein
MTLTAELKDALDAFQRGDLDRTLVIAERQMEAAPSPPWQHLLGLVHCRLGNPERGVSYLRSAAEAEPGNAGFQVMLARALVDSGQCEQVLAMPEPPPVANATALAMWQVRGEAADASGDTDGAVRAWTNVTRAAPDDWRGWAALASTLAAARRWPEAVEALLEAVRLNPVETALRMNLGSALASAGRHEDAILAFEEVERSTGRTAETSLGRAKSLMGLARFAEAEEAYRAVVSMVPDQAEAIEELGLVYERTGKADRIPTLLAQASAAGVPAERLAFLKAVLALRDGDADEADRMLALADREGDPVRWYRVKARLEDRRGNPQQAFEATVVMNRSVRDFDAWRERGAEYRRRLRELAGSIEAEAHQHPQLQPLPGRPLAFLVGFPRSGTTLLDTFLMGHPDIAVLEEVHLLGAAGMEIGRVADLARRSTDDLFRARETYLTQLANHVAPGFEGVVVDKLPLNIAGVPFIQAMFPGAPIIFAQRHPCDSVLSCFMQSFVMNDAMASFLTIEDSADLYDVVMSAWFGMRDAMAINTRAIVYEQLVEDPETSLRPLIEWLGLPWHDRILEHDRTAKERGTIITPSYDQVIEPLNTRASGRWMRYRQELEPVLPALLPWAARLGYLD